MHILNFADKEIAVLDGMIDADMQDCLVNNLSKSVWRFGWPVNDSYFSRQCWHVFIAGRRRPERMSCEAELTGDWECLWKFWRGLKRESLPPVKLMGVYANGQTCGQDAPIHRDNWGNEKGVTVLIFCNPFWATSWGGELVFYDDAKVDVIKSVLPKPGRVVIFDGSIPHAAKSPALSCDQLRMTIAFKTLLLPSVEHTRRNVGAGS